MFLVEFFGVSVIVSVMFEVMKMGYVGVEYVEYVMCFKCCFVLLVLLLCFGDFVFDVFVVCELDFVFYDEICVCCMKDFGDLVVYDGGEM